MRVFSATPLRSLLAAGPAVIPVLGALLSAVTAIGQVKAQAADLPRE